MKTLLLSTILCTWASFALADINEIPRQFRVWGSKAPIKLSQDPSPGKFGIDSINIPTDMKKVQPATNLLPPENCSDWQEAGMLPFVCHPMREVYSVTWPTPSEINRPVRAIATPGEYVSLAFAVRPLQVLSCLEFSITPFMTNDGKVVIPRNHIELRRVMDLPVPTRIDPKSYKIEPRYLERYDEFDFIALSPDKTERFWLTVKVPDAAPAGMAKANITVKTREGKGCVFQCAIRVLPFQLRKPDPFTEMTFSMLSNSNDSRTASWGRENRPFETYRLLADMAEHGMTSNVYEHAQPVITRNAPKDFSFDFEKPGMVSAHSMNTFLYMVNRAGLTGPFGFYNGPYEMATFQLTGQLKLESLSPEYNLAIREYTLAVEKQRAKQGWQAFIYFIGDEPASTNESMARSLNLGKQILAAYPEADVANFFNGMHAGFPDWKHMKEAHTINCANYFTREMIEESRAIGYRKIWNYNSAYCYDGDFRDMRIAYGFIPFRIGSNGVAQYKYREFFGDKQTDFSAYNHINVGRSDYDYSYPAADGPLPTQKWEAVRMGVNDYCYLYTLKKMIAETKDSNAAKKAQAELDAICSLFPWNYLTPDIHNRSMKDFSPEMLDTLRWRISQAIMNIQKASKE